MSDQVKAEDLFEKDFAKQAKAEIDATNKSVETFIVLAGQMKAISKDLAGIKFTDSRSVREYTDAASKAVIVEEKLKQEVIKTAKAAEDLATKQIRTSKVRTKALEDETKAITKQAKEQQKANSEYQQASDALLKLSKRQKDNVIAGREMSKTAKLVAIEHENLRSKIDVADHSVGNFQRNVGNYTMQLRAMQKELATLDPGTAKYDALAQKAGALKDKIGDAKDAVKAFSSESKATQAKTLFKQIGSDIADLNFSDAADKAKQFAGVIKSISFAEVVGGIKNLGSALLDMGKALLLNPLVMFVAGLAGAIYAINAYSDSFRENTEVIKENNEAIKKNIDETKRLAEEYDKLVVARLKSDGKISESDDKKIQALNKFSELQERQYAELKEAALKYRQEIGVDDANTIELKLSRQKQLDKRLLELAMSQAVVLRQAEKNLNEEIGAIDSEAYKEFQEKTKKKNEEAKKEYDRAAKERLDAYNEWADKMNKAIDEDEANKKAKKDAAHKKEVDDWKQGQKDAEEIADGMITQQAKDDAIIAEMEAKQKKRDEDAAEAKKKQLLEELNTTIDFAEKAMQRKDELREKELNNDLDMRQRNIMQQQQLAIAGRENTLAFEKAAAAKDEKAKQDLAIKQEKREKAIAFLKLFAAYADKGEPDQALAKTLEQMAIAGAIAGSYFEGTENVGEDLKGNKVHNGRDGYVIAVDGSERVLTGNQNAMIGNMSNDELAKLARDHQDGYLPKYITDGNTGSFAQNTTNALLLSQVITLNDEIKEIKQVLRDRPVPSWTIDKDGTVSMKELKNGLTKATTYKKGTPLNYI